MMEKRRKKLAKLFFKSPSFILVNLKEEVPTYTLKFSYKVDMCFSNVLKNIKLLEKAGLIERKQIGGRVKLILLTKEGKALAESLERVLGGG